MSSHEARAKEAALAEQCGLCAICSQGFRVVEKAPRNQPLAHALYQAMFKTWEHMTPRAHGGGEERENRCIAHKICNEYRNDGTDPGLLRVLEAAKKTDDCVLYLVQDRLRRRRQRAVIPRRFTFEPE